jgi:hypothetical protein
VNSQSPPPIDLDRLTDDQREGLACIRCGRRTGGDGPMRPITTPGNPQSTMVFEHRDGCTEPGGVS